MMRHAILVMFAAGAALAAQDSLQLIDGRFVFGPKIERHQKGVVIHYPHGDVVVPQALIKTCTALDAAANDASWTDEEKAKLARGLVPFEGSWIRQDRRDAILAKRVEERAARIEEAKKRQKWKDRYQTETAHFAFEYTIDPDVMKDLIEMMEVYYKAFTKEWGIRKPSKMGKLKVCFYHDRDYYEQVTGQTGGVIGYFRFVEPLELAFFYDRLDPDLTVDVMFHETNHYLTHLIDPKFKYPSWVNESLAEYYGASEWDPDKKRMEIGLLQEGRLAVVQDEIKLDHWQGLEELIRLEHGAFNALHYAWGWTFVHYLLSSPRYEKSFKAFYLALARDKSVERERWSYDMKTVTPDEQIRVLKKMLGVDDLASLEKEWHEYVKGLQVVSRRGYEFAGKLALGRGMPIKAQRFFKTALDMGSKNPMTHYGYAQALSQKQKFAEAVEQLEKAIEGDPLNGLFYIRLAHAKGRLPKADKKEVERLRDLAVEIEPDNYSVLLESMYDFGRLISIDGGR